MGIAEAHSTANGGAGSDGRGAFVAGASRPPLPRGRVTDWVADELSNLIVEGTFPPGAPLPPEGTLAVRFGVSRVAVREAVKMLVVRGLIQVRHGVGLFAAGTSSKPVSEALTLLLRRERVGPEALLEARRLLEVEIAGLAAERATDDDLRRLDQALRDLANADQPLEAQIAADTDFHVSLARAAHNSVFLAISEAVRQPLTASMRVTYPVDGGPARRQREHAAIFDAVRSRHPKEAREAMARMLEMTAQAIRRQSARAPPAAGQSG